MSDLFGDILKQVSGIAAAAVEQLPVVSEQLGTTVGKAGFALKSLTTSPEELEVQIQARVDEAVSAAKAVAEADKQATIAQLKADAQADKEAAVAATKAEAQADKEAALEQAKQEAIREKVAAVTEAVGMERDARYEQYIVELRDAALEIVDKTTAGVTAKVTTEVTQATKAADKAGLEGRYAGMNALQRGAARVMRIKGNILK